MDDASVTRRLAELGLELPPAPQAVAAYVPVVVAGHTAFVAGQIPTEEGRILNPGRVGDDVSVDEARQGAARAALQALSALRAALGDLGRVDRIAQVTVFMAATPEFTEHPLVANGVSELLIDVLGDAGRHARAAIGVSSLPLGASVEVAMTARVTD